jgi:hypothetical protein
MLITILIRILGSCRKEIDLARGICTIGILPLALTRTRYLSNPAGNIHNRNTAPNPNQDKIFVLSSREYTVEWEYCP